MSEKIQKQVNFVFVNGVLFGIFGYTEMRINNKNGLIRSYYFTQKKFLI